MSLAGVPRAGNSGRDVVSQRTLRSDFLRK